MGRTVVIVVALRLYCGPCGVIVVTGCDIVVTVVVLRSCRDTVLTAVALWWHCDDAVITVVVLWSLWWYCGHCVATVMIICGFSQRAHGCKERGSIAKGACNFTI